MKTLIRNMLLACGLFAVALSTTIAAPNDVQPPRGEPPMGQGFDKTPLGGIPPYLRGIALSEAQQDKIFAIRHAQVPAMRENEKQKRKALEALSALPQGDTFDEKQAQQLAEKLGSLTKEAVLNRTLTDYKIMSLLTPDQRIKVAEMKSRKPDFEGRHGDPINFKAGCQNPSKPMAM